MAEGEAKPEAKVDPRSEGKYQCLVEIDLKTGLSKVTSQAPHIILLGMLAQGICSVARIQTMKELAAIGSKVPAIVKATADQLPPAGKA
jgi:hypothetical protein